MWPDNDTNIDFLNFTGVADAVGELVLQADGRPISIGVSGAWGTGKSSLIKLIRGSLQRKAAGQKQFVFVEFNAWLYQGYDDARAALVEVIADSLKSAAIRTAIGLHPQLAAERQKELCLFDEILRLFRFKVSEPGKVADLRLRT